MKTKIITIVLLIGTLNSVFAYPISPRPLRKLIIESELIVFAKVIGIENVQNENPRENTLAILEIKEILQGKTKTDTIKVAFRSGMTCPSPARYIQNSTVLAFLNQMDDTYTTQALSYGSKTMDKVSYNIYKSRILEMQEILKIKNIEEQASKTIDWFLSCATNPVTRWEGIYELSPESDFMSFYDKDKNDFSKKHQLNKHQKAILRKAFFSIEKLQYDDMGLIDLIADRYDQELIDFLIKKLKSSDVENMWFSGYLMPRIAELTNRDDLREILKAIDAIDYLDDNRNEKTNQLTKTFIEKL